MQVSRELELRRIEAAKLRTERDRAACQLRDLEDQLTAAQLAVSLIEDFMEARVLFPELIEEEVLAVSEDGGTVGPFEDSSTEAVVLSEKGRPVYEALIAGPASADYLQEVLGLSANQLGGRLSGLLRRGLVEQNDKNVWMVAAQ